MSDRTTNVAFVRTEQLPPQAPPVTAAGPVKWVRENLFSNIPYSILTLAAIYCIYLILSGFLPWLFGGVWDTS